MHKKIQLMKKIVASTLLFLALITPGQKIAHADDKQSSFLLRLDCADAGIGNWGYRNENIVVGRAVYPSRFYMGAGDSSVSLTCRLQPNDKEVNFQNLQLAFGMEDNNRVSPNVNVNIYLDGILVTSQSVFSGKAESISLNVTNVRNVSIETVCTNKLQYCDRVYFWDATLGIIP